MKMNARGFTLVELMIVIAIIGILAAALFPMMSGYMARSRDTARISHINQIATALSSYYADKSSYPYPSSGGPCLDNTGGLVAYMSVVPKDPTTGHLNAGCATFYGYGTGFSDAAGTTPAFFLAANMENQNGGNTGGLAATFVLDGAEFDSIQTNVKGTGSGYVLAR